jgi:hypothetical protein
MIHWALAGIVALGGFAAYQMVTAHPRRSESEIINEINDISTKAPNYSEDDFNRLNVLANELESIGSENKAKAVRQAVKEVKMLKYKTDFEV